MQRLPQRHDRQYESAQSGFTLIELLLSIVIFAVVLTAVNGVLFGALKLRNKTTHSLDLILPIEHASLVVRRDLEGLVPPGGAFAVSLKSGAVTGVSSADTGLEFYSNTGSLSDLQPWGNIQRVGYLLMDSTNRVASMRSGKDLVRVVTRNLLSPTQEPPLSRSWSPRCSSIECRRRTRTARIERLRAGVAGSAFPEWGREDCG